MNPRYLSQLALQDLQTKMVFLGGPRQVGKTTLAVSLQKHFKTSVLLNWDKRGHKSIILKEQWSPDVDLLIFDEIHKYRSWKSFVKGVWDTRTNNCSVLVTGSSRLDIFRRGGDSLLGRYHYLRLHPFTLNEWLDPKKSLPHFSKNPPPLLFKQPSLIWKKLFEFGGFPEPLFKASVPYLKRWQTERLERLFREDVRAVEQVRDFSKMELLAELLPPRVGSPLSVQSLTEDCEVTHKTLSLWLQILERNYYIYRILPYSKKLARALKKESKYYLWDWSEISNDGSRFENMIAGHLLKFCHFYHDAYGIKIELYYLRDREKREVDFLITWENSPWLLVEAKLTGKESDGASLNYFGSLLGVQEKYLVSGQEGVDYKDKKTGVHFISASKFLTAFL